jgi:hypothetical protein
MRSEVENHVRAWNSQHAAGALVDCAIPGRELVRTRTRGAAFLSGGAALVYVEGERYPVLLKHLVPIAEARTA